MNILLNAITIVYTELHNSESRIYSVLNVYLLFFKSIVHGKVYSQHISTIWLPPAGYYDGDKMRVQESWQFKLTWYEKGNMLGTQPGKSL